MLMGQSEMKGGPGRRDEMDVGGGDGDGNVRSSVIAFAPTVPCTLLQYDNMATTSNPKDRNLLAVIGDEVSAVVLLHGPGGKRVGLGD